MHKEYYSILGVSVKATNDEIKKAYRILSKRWHPDMNPDRDTTAIMQDVNEAYYILSNPLMRARYDAEHAPTSACFDVDDLVVIRTVKMSKESATRLVLRVLSRCVHCFFDVMVDGVKEGSKFILKFACIVAVILVLAGSEASNDNKTASDEWMTIEPTCNTNYQTGLHQSSFFDEKSERNPFSIYRLINAMIQNNQIQLDYQSPYSK